MLAACSSSDSKSVTGPPTGPASLIIALNSLTQTGTIGQLAGTRPSIRVMDSTRTGVPGVAVTFTVVSGGGSVTGGTQTTDGNGVATLGSWTLGPSAGTNILRASAAGVSSVLVFGAAGAATASGFNIQVQYLQPATESQQTAFVSAAARWSRIITGDIGQVALPKLDMSVCGAPAGDSVSGVVNDLLIQADLKPYDGVGGVLGAASPCYSRISGRQLPLVGYMFFDTADLANLESSGNLDDVILHEMGHVLGFGTYWDPPSPDSLLTTTDTIVGSTIGFFGPNAVVAFVAHNGGSGTRVPVEDNGVAGTTRSHWKETVFNDELMTGYISGTVHPLSLTTVESMADLGYTVDPTAADPFNLLTSTTIRAGQAAPGFWLVNDVIRVPRRYVDERTGQVVPGPTH